MKFRTKDLEKYLKKKVNWEKIAEELTLKSFETNYSKGILEIDILPNRYPDASSIIGILKELKRIGQIKSFQEPKPNLLKKKNQISPIRVINQIEKFCPYYFGKVIFHTKNQSSPQWLKDFVEFYGFNSVNFLVDLANFVMIEYGAPLHIFDLDKIEGNIFVRLAKKGEKFISLDNKEYILSGGEIVIADKKKILALGGIKGGKLAEITLETKNIFIEAAVFNPEKIYETSRRLNLKTEASFRFERKVAPLRTLLALIRVASLIQENLGGEILADIIGFKEIKPRKIKFDFSKVEKISGIKLTSREIIKIFRALEIKSNKNYLLIPQDRLDLNSDEDIVEEIVRIYGWNKIKPAFEISQKEVFIDEKIGFTNCLRKVLTKLGYYEGYNYNFYGEKEKELVENLFKETKSHLAVFNPLSENYQYFQLSLVPNLLKAVFFNQPNFKEVRLFEIEKISYWEKVPEENYNLAIVFAFKDSLEILKELKGVLQKVFAELGIDFELRLQNNFLTEIFVAQEKIGFFGLIPRKYLEIFKIDLPVGFIELNLEKLRKHKSEIKKFSPWPVFPGIYRDLSFFVEEKIKSSQILKEIKKLKVNYLEKVEIIDIYFPQDNQNKKSITLRFFFYHPQRTLQDKEAEKEQKKIEEFLKEKFKAEIR